LGTYASHRPLFRAGVHRTPPSSCIGCNFTTNTSQSTRTAPPRQASQRGSLQLPWQLLPRGPSRTQRQLCRSLLRCQWLSVVRASGRAPVLPRQVKSCQTAESPWPPAVSAVASHAAVPPCDTTKRASRPSCDWRSGLPLREGSPRASAIARGTMTMIEAIVLGGCQTAG